MKNFRIKNLKKYFFLSSEFWQVFFLSLCVTIFWRIFFPGLMSNDSNDQYLQAALGSFTDWHPPLMSIVLSYFLKFGGLLNGLAALILCQSYIAIFGLRFLISLLLEFFSERKIDKSSCRLAATVLTVLFLIPLFTPFMYFSVIFWKDTWLTIILIWVISFIFRLFLNIESLSKKGLFLQIILISLLSSLFILIRHNALIILPVIGTILTLVGKTNLGRIGWFSSIFLLFFTIVANPAVNYIFDVKPNYIGNLVLGNDFAKMLKFYPQLQAVYPLAAVHEYIPVVCHKHIPIYWGLNLDREDTELKDEYSNALLYHRSELLYTRLYLFWQMLDYETWYAPKVSKGIDANEIGLKSNEEFENIRIKLFYLSEEVGHRWYFVWISGLHIFWLILNILFSIYYLVKFFLARENKNLFLFLIYLIPLSYYFSYVLAAVSPDYRYMYPATLIMQVLTACAIASLLWTWMRPKIIFLIGVKIKVYST